MEWKCKCKDFCINSRRNFKIAKQQYIEFKLAHDQITGNTYSYNIKYNKLLDFSYKINLNLLLILIWY